VRLIQIRDYKTDAYATYIPHKLAKKFCTADDVMIGRYGPPIFQILRGLEGAYNVALIKATPSKEVSKDYLFYFLNQKSLFNLIDRLSRRTSGQTGVDLDALREFEFPLPPLEEQQAICDVLKTWDKAIKTIEKLISAKVELKKGLRQQLLTGKKRFQEFAGQEWKEIPLGKVFREVKDTNDGDSQHSIMTISSRLGLISQEDKFDRVIAGDSLKKYTQLKRGDFAYNKGNSKSYQMGCIYQLEDRERALVPFVYICFRPTDAVCPEFYKHWFLAHGLDRQLKKIITSGARGDGLLNVNTDDFFKLKVPFPSKEEQAAIAQVFQALDKEIVLLQENRAALKEQKRGLMQQLLPGKKRVKVDAQAEREAVAI
jgi:type I restriction enzyme S subunit